MIVGIDIGGTKTDIAVLSESKVKVTTISSDVWRTGDLFEDVANPKRLIDHVRAVVPKGARPILAIGAHGCDTSALIAHFRDSIIQQDFASTVYVSNDAELLGHTIGIAEAINVVVGTGSIVLARDVNGNIVTAGGYGWIFGDPASAPGIIRRLVQLYLAENERRPQKDAAIDVIMRQYSVSTAMDLAHVLTVDLSRAHWAALAPLVFEAIEDSQLLQRVVKQAAAELAGEIAIVRERSRSTRDIAVAGGVISHQPLLLDELTAQLAHTAPELNVHLLNRAPVYGALEIGRRIEHRNTSSWITHQVEESQHQTAVRN